MGAEPAEPAEAEPHCQCKGGQSTSARADKVPPYGAEGIKLSFSFNFSFFFLIYLYYLKVAKQPCLLTEL